MQGEGSIKVSLFGALVLGPLPVARKERSLGIQGMGRPTFPVSGMHLGGWGPWTFQRLSKRSHASPKCLLCWRPSHSKAKYLSVCLACLIWFTA